MMELQTREGQAAHYAAVRMRLMASAGPRPVIVPRPPVPVMLALPAPRTASESLARLRSKPKLTPTEMVRLLCFKNDVDFDSIINHSRRAPLPDLRQEMVFIVWAVKGLTLQGVGKVFGNRHHTTVLHAIRKCCDRYGIKCDPEDRADAAKIGLAILRDAGWNPVQPIQTQEHAQ